MAPLSGESDALNALNLKQGAAANSTASHAHDAGHGHVPALDVGGSAMADMAGSGVPWQAPSVPSIATSRPSQLLSLPRQRNTKLIFAFLGIVAVIVVVVTFNLMKKPAAFTVDKPKATGPEEGFAALSDKIAQEKAQKTGQEQPTVVAPAEPPAPVKIEDGNRA